jgi:D-3-phosphoglycerate dehydrogenase
MFKIQVLNPIAAIGLNQFPHESYQTGSELKEPDAILVRSYDMHAMNIGASVKVIGRAGAGTNNIPVAALTKRGIPVLNTPGANANAVRELVIAGMLLSSRNICEAWQYVNGLQSEGEALEKEIEQNKKQFAGFELMGKTLGVIGLGSVGVKVANSAIGLGMKVIGYDPAITIKNAWELSSSVQQEHMLDALLSEADFITFHVPLISETKNMLNHTRMPLLKKNAVILNFSREGIVDNKALMDALNEKKISSYICDFPNAELKNHPRVICLPHLGASTREAEDNCAIMVVKQVRDYLEYGSITNSVNFPAVDLPVKYTGTRLTIANANIPNMVAQMSTVLAAAKLNISSLINQSRNEVAYTVIDVEQVVSDAVLDEIRKIEGVLQVRQML